MSYAWMTLIAFAFVIGCLCCGILAAWYHWGRFAALTTLRNGSPKWKAFALALMPALVFMLAFAASRPVISPELIFVSVAIPSAIGTVVRFQAGVE